MYCTNCGAEIAPTDARCPYCGMLNPYGAEKEYMEKLEGIRRETASLGDMAGDEVKSEVKKTSKKILVIAGIIIGLIAGLIIAAFLMERHQDRQWEREDREEIAFERQYFDELNELYDSGDDQAVMDFWMLHEEETGGSALYDWEHADYYVYYYPFDEAIAVSRQIMAKGGPSDSGERDDLGFGVYGALSLLYDYENNEFINTLKGRDKERADAIAAEGEALLMEDLGLDAASQTELYKSCCDKDGFLSYQMCCDALNNLL